MPFALEHMSRSALPKKVVISGTILGLGGIRTHLVLLMKLLRREKTDVLVLATGACWDEELLSELECLGVQFVLPPKLLRPCRRLSTLYSGLLWPVRLPRTASSVYCIGAGYSHLLVQRFRPKGAVTLNHEIVVPPGPRSLAGLCAQRLDATVANSRKVAEVMASYWPQKPMRVIPFLTSDRPSPPPRRQTSGSAQGLKVIYLGRLVEQKRPDHLVRAWPALTSHPALLKARLDVHGNDPSGHMIGALREWVAKAGLSSRIGIHGEYRLQDLPCLLNQADLVVLPSLWEGLPLVLIEAMSRGVPFVATAAGGTEELGEDNPDVKITSTEWAAFEAGLLEMAERLQTGQVDPVRLHNWSEQRYGYGSVSQRWLKCLHEPVRFFSA